MKPYKKFVENSQNSAQKIFIFFLQKLLTVELIFNYNTGNR